MIFGIAQYTNLSTEQNSWINELSEDLKLFFNTRSYGKDLNELYFGLITVKPEFDNFFKKRKPRYRPGEQISIVDGIEIRSTNCVEIDCKIEFSDVSNLGKIELINKVCKKLLLEADCLLRIPRLNNFDYNSFRLDFEGYLIEKFLH